LISIKNGISFGLSPKTTPQMNERSKIAIKLIASHIVLLLVLILFSIILTNDRFLSLSITQTVLIILYLAGYWEFFGIKFRKLFCLTSQVAIITIFFWKYQKGWNNHTNPYLIISLAAIQAYLLFELIKILFVILKKDKVFVEISFPFRSGDYLITDGGNSKISRLMNYHYYSPIHKKNKTNNSMLYATDIVKITKTHFLPKTNNEYPIFGENLYSPMEGIVVKVEKSIPDNDTFSGNYPYNTGNTVVIKKNNHYLLIGHLKKDSIKVKPGDIVNKNDLLGLVGNSGWTERPHLHMQLIESDSDNYWRGKGICIKYKNLNLYKNRFIKV